MKIFVNCSNHPSAKWSAAQREAAEQYGKIADIPFPAVACDLTDMQLEELAKQTAAEILAKKPAAVMCMGEFVVCFRIVQKLKKSGIKVLASCSERHAVEHVEKDGTVHKEAVFVFQGFREY